MDKTQYDPTAARKEMLAKAYLQIDALYKLVKDARSAELSYAPNATGHVDDFDALLAHLHGLNDAVLAQQAHLMQPGHSAWTESAHHGYFAEMAELEGYGEAYRGVTGETMIKLPNGDALPLSMFREDKDDEGEVQGWRATWAGKGHLIVND